MRKKFSEKILSYRDKFSDKFSYLIREISLNFGDRYSEFSFSREYFANRVNPFYAAITLVSIIFVLSVFTFFNYGSSGASQIDRGIYAPGIGSSTVFLESIERYTGFDIAYTSPSDPPSVELFSTGIGGVLLSTRFIPVVVALFVLIAFFWKRFLRVRYGGIILVLLLLIFSVNISDGYALGDISTEGENWEPVNGSLTYIFYGQDGAINLDVSESSQGGSEIAISLNGEKWNSYNVNGRENIYLPSVEGKNKIVTKSDSCEKTGLNGESSGVNCPSFVLESVSYNSTDDFDEPVLRGFYSEDIGDSPWMRENSDIIFNVENNDSIPVIQVDRVPYIEHSDLLIKLNGEKVKDVSGDDLERKLYLDYDGIREGINHIQLVSDKCRVPAEEDPNSEDSRCLSYRLQNFSVQDLSQVPQFIFGEGWYSEGSRGRWMQNESEMQVRMDEKNSMISLDLRRYSGLEKVEAEVTVNGRLVRSISVDERKRVFIPVDGRKGLNDVEIRARDGCRVPARNGGSDTRCLSLFLHDIEVFTLDRETIFQKGWYDKEKTDYGSFRWMNTTSYMVFNSTGEDIMTVSGKEYDYLGNSSLQIFKEGEAIADIDSNEFEKEQISVSTDPGITTLRFESSGGCVTPAEIEDSADNRCLSYRLDSLQLDEKSFGDGWFSEEGGSDFSYRWMSEEAEMKYPAGSGETEISLEFKPYEYLSDPVLDIYSDGERVKAIDLDGPGRVNRNVEIQTEEGVRSLVFRSRNGCELPSDHEKFSNDIRCLSFQFSSIEIE